MKPLRLPFLFLLMALTASLVSVSGCGGGGPDPATDLGGINTGELLQGLLARTERAMSHVNGIDSAKTARRELQRINEDYDDLLYHLPQLSEEGRAALARQSSQALPELRALVRQIYEMPALDDILGATLNEMLAKLEMVR